MSSNSPQPYSQQHKMGLAFWLTLPAFIIGYGFLIYSKLSTISENTFKDALIKVLWDEEILPGLIIITIVLIFLKSVKLTWKFDQVGFHFQFIPVIWKFRTITWEEIERVEFMAIRPLRDFGGWGFRSSLKYGRVYTTSGKHVIRLTLRNGKILNFTAIQNPNIDKWINRT